MRGVDTRSRRGAPGTHQGNVGLLSEKQLSQRQVSPHPWATRSGVAVSLRNSRVHRADNTQAGQELMGPEDQPPAPPPCWLPQLQPHLTWEALSAAQVAKWHIPPTPSWAGGSKPASLIRLTEDLTAKNEHSARHHQTCEYQESHYTQQTKDLRAQRNRAGNSEL